VTSDPRPAPLVNAHNAHNGTASILIGIEPKSGQNGGYLCAESRPVPGTMRDQFSDVA
jgi:hypothetical protein